MSEWPFVRAGKVATQRREIVRLEEGIEYTTMGVRWYGKGAYDRGLGSTKTIKAKTLFRARAGDFVFNRIDTQKGAFDVVPTLLDGALASNEFPLYVVDPDRLDARFLHLIFQQESVLAKIDAIRAGSEGRSRWKEADFEGWLIPLPTLSEQRRIVDVMAAVDTQIEALTSEISRLEVATDALRDESFRGLLAEVKPAAEMFDMLLGRQKSARQSVGPHVLPYIRAGNIGSGGLKLQDVQTMNFAPTEQEKYGLLPDDIVLAEGGTVGLATRWSGEIPGIVGFDKHVIRLRQRPGISTSEYALQWCHWSRQVGAFDAQATGITISALGFGRASAMPVPALSVREQEDLVSPMAGAALQVAGLRSNVETLREFRSALLSSLLDQEIEIPRSYDSLLKDVS